MKKEKPSLSISPKPEIQAQLIDLADKASSYAKHARILKKQIKGTGRNPLELNIIKERRSDAVRQMLDRVRMEFGE